MVCFLMVHPRTCCLPQLMHEEAFYLAFEIGSLTIKRTTTGAVVTAPDFWCRVQARAPCFASTYTVYKQLRSKNWWVAVPAVAVASGYACSPVARAPSRIVRSGVRAGSDFVIYRRGPDVEHAPYSVRVVSVTAGGKQAPSMDATWFLFQVCPLCFA